MTSPFKGAIQQALVGRSGPKGPIGRAVQGALARVPRPAPLPKGPPPSIAKGQAFRGRNAGPIKPNPVTEADQTLGQTGEGLRRTIGRIATGRMITAAKGGKIDSVETLVKKFNQAQKDFREGKEQSPRKQQRLRNRLRAMGYDFTGKPEGSEDEIQPITPPSKPPKKFKEGGKVGGAMSALQKLAQQYRAALDRKSVV